MATEAIFHLAFWVLFAGLFVMRIFFALTVSHAGERVIPEREAVEREGWFMFADQLVMYVLLLIGLGLHAINPDWLGMLSVPLPGWLRWAPFALGLATLGFWSWTQVVLGKKWSPQLQPREEHQLITIGPYRRIRHPLYIAMLGYGTSLALVTANPVFILLTVTMIASLLARAPKEEKMMIEKFGEEYRLYRRSTGRFFPT